MEEKVDCNCPTDGPKRFWFLVIGLSCLLAACARSGATRLAGTTYLGEVSYILTRDQVMANTLGYGRVTNLSSDLMAEGVSERAMTDGRVVAIQGAWYWHNTTSGRHYQRLIVAVVPEGVRVQPGNIVELVDPGESHFLQVQRVRAADARQGDCGYVEALASPAVQVTKDAIGLLTLLGPPGHALLYCKGIENEGWVQNGAYWSKPPAVATRPVN